MRTTITLDPDVAAKVKAEMRQSGRSFKEAVNLMLRRAANTQNVKEEPFRLLPGPSGERPGFNFDNIGELLEQVEGPWHK